MVSPAFAYVTKHADIDVQTSPYHDGRPARRVIQSRFGETYNRPTVGARRTHYSTSEREVAPVRTNARIVENAGGIHTRLRTTAVQDSTGRSVLQRHTLGRRLRRLNRMPKADQDRYRILNLRPNTRSIRMRVEGNESSYLPSSLVQTGGNASVSGEWGWDRTTRRDVRYNNHYGVQKRNRDLLVEIKNSARSN